MKRVTSLLFMICVSVVMCAQTQQGYVKTKLKKGTSVRVSRQSKSWVYVTYKGGSGWVSAKYLKKYNKK